MLRPALLCALTVVTTSNVGGQEKPNQRSSTSQPAASETIAAACRRLEKIGAKKLTGEQTALKVGLELCLAIGEADGERAAKLLDAVGYQALPLTGLLPEDPTRPVMPAAFRERIDRRPHVPVGDLPVDTIEVVERERLRREFPAVAEWMLAQDVAVVIRHTPQAPEAWAKCSCCVVIRLRAGKPSIIGGNLLEALVRPTTQESVGDS